MSTFKRFTPDMSPQEILARLRESSGYYLVNNERDVSQSDFKGRIMPRTTLRAAPYRDETGFFAFEISGGASVHMDLMHKHINPLEKLRLVSQAMPRTMLQAVCRGRNLFGYRPYPENVQRTVIREFSRHVHVWRLFDFMNHMPNLRIAADEIRKANRLLSIGLCINIGPNHTLDFYLGKVQEIVETFGSDIILCIKNHSGIGTPRHISRLVQAIHQNYPDLVLAYHGHNTDGNDLARMVAAVEEGVKVVEVADHGLGGMFSQAPALSLVQTLHDYGYRAPGLKVQPLLDASDLLRRERKLYQRFESPFRGFDPTVKVHKLTGGAASISFEQAEKLGLLPRFHEVMEELSRVNHELGDLWSVSPGSQILWATAVSNFINGRYEQPSEDLKNLLLGKYGPFPFYRPADWIMKKVLEHNRKDNRSWTQILELEKGVKDLPQADLEGQRKKLEKGLGRKVDSEELCLYLLFPKHALDYFQFQDTFGQTWLLPPEIWFRQGGFTDGERIPVPDEYGKTHFLDIISTRRQGEKTRTSLLVDHHFQTYTVTPKTGRG